MTLYLPSNERAYFDHGWLKSYHTFSFGSYYDPRFINFHNLRVLNQDWIAGGGGFAPHPHRDMEIVTYLFEGELQHADSAGHELVLKAQEVQTMSAGDGITHSEVNASASKPCQLLQLWFFPHQKGGKPDHAQAAWTPEQKRNQLCLLVTDKRAPQIQSPEARAALTINSPLDMYACLLEKDQRLNFTPKREGVWLQLIEGTLQANEHLLRPGDGLGLELAQLIELNTQEKAHFLLMDLGAQRL